MPRCINFKKCGGRVAVWEGKEKGRWVCMDCRLKNNIPYQNWKKYGKGESFSQFIDKIERR